MQEYIEVQSRGLLNTLKNILTKREVYFFTFIFVFLVNIYLFRKVEFLQTTKVEFISNTELNEPENISVEISGAVINPGVYVLSKDKLLVDLIKMSGGFNSRAASEFVMKEINMSSILAPNTKYYIPFSWEYIDMKNNKITQLTGTKLMNEPSSFNAELTIESSENRANVNNNMSLLNKITKEQLISLNGIGEKYADRVLAGIPYNDIDDFYLRCNIPKSLCEKVLNDIE